MSIFRYLLFFFFQKKKGKSLSEEEKLKLSNTALMDVLNDELELEGGDSDINRDASAADPSQFNGKANQTGGESNESM